jgi:hypothetical protein
MAPEFSTAPTVFIRRKGPMSPKVSALIEILMKQRDLKGRRPMDGVTPRQSRANGHSRSDRARRSPAQIERFPSPSTR